ncbi:MAG TPA: septum formation initiator family protein [Rhizomicrobium sp.]|nr:septum formation initiator family protein [Rhizomicrobium sp.]
MTRFFTASIVPAICVAVIGYFGYAAVWGERGAFALANARTAIGIREQQLAQVRDTRVRLQHRIGLLEPGHVDQDLVEELARGDLMDGQPGQVAIPRTAH